MSNEEMYRTGSILWRNGDGKISNGEMVDGNVSMINVPVVKV